MFRLAPAHAYRARGNRVKVASAASFASETLTGLSTPVRSRSGASDSASGSVRDAPSLPILSLVKFYARSGCPSHEMGNVPECCDDDTS